MGLQYIDIIGRRLVVHRSLPRLHFHGYSKVNSFLQLNICACSFLAFFPESSNSLKQVTSASTKLQNTGRALVIDIQTEAGQEGRLSGGNLPEEYVLLQVLIVLLSDPFTEAKLLKTSHHPSASLSLGQLQWNWS